MAKTISQLPDATSVADGDELIVQQSGITKRATKLEVIAGIKDASIASDAAIAGSKLADGGITAAKLNGAQTGSAPIYGCRAWVNFDGTRNEADTGSSTNGANVKIRASGNVSSVLKNGIGDYTVTFTTAMQDASYSAIVTGSADFHTATSLASGSLVIVTSDGAFQPLNASLISVAVFR
jgi:hypothetical protein